MGLFQRLQYWTCSMCGSVWPANTTVDAFLKRVKANEVHPGTQCEKETSWASSKS